MLKRLLFIAALCLVGCTTNVSIPTTSISTVTPALAGPPFPMNAYWPMTPGSSIDYVVYQITGKYNPADMTLSVWSRTISPINAYQTVTALRVPTPEPSVYLVSTLTGQPVPTLATLADTTPFPYLINGLWQPANGSTAWLGESTVLRPYEALITANPVVGEKLINNSQANTYDANYKITQWTFYYNYSTISKGPWGPKWPDTYRTGMLENPNLPGQFAAYNYVFAKGIGQVDYWKCTLDANNMCIAGTGYEWYAVAWRGQ